MEAKKRDYMSGGLGSSKQEKFAQLWRNKDLPDEAKEVTELPKDLSAWDKEIERAERVDALVPDANWRLRAAPEPSSGAATSATAKSLASGRAIAVDAWTPLVTAEGSSYDARDAWFAVDAQDAASLVVVAGNDAAAVDAVTKALHDKLPRTAGYIVVVAPGDAAGTAKKRKKKFGSKIASLYDPTRTFAAACGLSLEPRVLVLAPPHPSPEAHTIVAKFPCNRESASSVADAIILTLKEKRIIARGPR